MPLLGFLFFGFVLLAAALFAAAPRRWRPYVLLAASLVFYTCVDGRLPYVLAIPTVVDYLIARKIASAKDRGPKRRWLSLSIVVNVLVLGFFKYVQFFVDGACGLLTHVGVAEESCH